MDGYKYLVAGWVSGVTVKETMESETLVMLAKVRHSQAVNAAPLRPWIAAKKNGTEVCAHCTCTAGLGEGCSHVSALLFAAETRTRMMSDVSITSLPCQWLGPSPTDVPFARTVDIEFESPASKKSKLTCPSPSTTSTTKSRQRKVVQPPSKEEEDMLFERLASSSRAVVLSTHSSYSDRFLPKTVDLSLRNLFDAQLLQADYQPLLITCEEAYDNLSISIEQAAEIEKATRKQAECKRWFEMRAGRVTASLFKAAAHTSKSHPSVSLIKRICYPESTNFSTEATVWGRSQEKTALKQYEKETQKNHCNFAVKNSGLVIHPDYPHLGATPDGLVNCSCCGFGVIEIKCPFTYKHSTVEQASKKEFLLE
eukprot:m.246173 g.246173  ORF g.246173 m.246173 type:complete len:368 (+) comp40259_c1_seq1:486-1589(+)